MRTTLDEIKAVLHAGFDSRLKQELITKEDFANSIQVLQTKLDEGLNRMEELRTRTDDILPDFCPSGSPNGIYQIKLRDLEPFKAPCATSPPGYTVIQRRIDGSENFNRTWEEYKTGFGNVRREFFIGLEKLHRMTEARPHELFIKLRKDNGSTSYAHYDNFAIGSEEESYQLKNIGEYSGEAGDSLRESEHQKFSTLDRDNDNLSNFNCASKNGACWLNGKYFKDGKGRNGIHWISWQHYDWSMSLTFVEMMIRPKSL
ncbi:fibroleukin-like [Drosophila rhopaloa]|uniref:Fibroleukin-like n=1 Tax=Drosophila rhopaloa TaxID=1041015 RepID=A0A6P4EYP9_DRORH|nr:fibroleukin-like [Drosophila rhopaloa]